MNAQSSSTTAVCVYAVHPFNKRTILAAHKTDYAAKKPKNSKRSLTGGKSGMNKQKHTLKISAIFRCCGREQWFSMDRMTGMSELTNAARLTASTTSWRIVEDILV